MNCPLPISLLEERGTPLSIEARNWICESLYFDGDEYFKSVIEKIEAAKTEVLLESYIFDLDGIGLNLMHKLDSAVKRGIHVRILVDGIGSYNFLSQLQSDCEKRNIWFRVYHPLPFKLSTMQKITWRKLKRWLNLFRRINKRNHRKTIIIDGNSAFLGSYNISQVHSKKWLGKNAWRDTGIYVEGPDVEYLRADFLDAWSKSKHEIVSAFSVFRKKRKKLNPDNLIRLNSKTLWRFSLLRDLKKRFNGAREKILITNAYFLPRRTVLRYLRKAARRGVYVALCIPAKSDVWFVKAAAKSLYYRLLKAGVHIFEYQPTVLHAKTLIIDNWATVGSHNLNHRSLQHDLEVEAVVREKVNIEKLNAQWAIDIANAKEIKLIDLGKLSLWSRIISRFAYWFRYWI